MTSNMGLCGFPMTVGSLSAPHFMHFTKHPVPGRQAKELLIHKENNYLDIIHTWNDNLRFCGQGGVFVGGNKMTVRVSQIAQGLDHFGIAEVHVKAHYHCFYLQQCERETDTCETVGREGAKPDLRVQWGC